MKKSKNNDSIIQNLFFIKEGLIEIKNNDNKIDFEKLETYIKTVNLIIIAFKGVKRLFLILFAIIAVLVGYIVISSEYNSEVLDFNAEIKNLKNDSLVRKILEIKEVEKGDSITTSYNYILRNDKLVTYNMLLRENDSLSSKNDSIKNILDELIDKNKNLKSKLNLVFDNYPIKIIETDKYITIESKQIDSSMILLKAYRHKMYFDNSKNHWIIKDK